VRIDTPIDDYEERRDTDVRIAAVDRGDSRVEKGHPQMAQMIADKTVEDEPMDGWFAIARISHSIASLSPRPFVESPSPPAVFLRGEKVPKADEGGVYATLTILRRCPGRLESTSLARMTSS
jgi:hypothetical protein